MASLSTCHQELVVWDGNLVKPCVCVVKSVCVFVSCTVDVFMMDLSTVCTVCGHCRQAIEDTKWANLKPLFCARSVFIVSDEPSVADLMAVLKKTPEFVILGTGIASVLCVCLCISAVNQFIRFAAIEVEYSTETVK